MPEIITQTSYLFLFCLWLAIFEIQIEGKDGWATKLPTWRPGQDKWYARIYSAAMGGKEMTGYHILVFGFVLIFLHYPYFAGQDWNYFLEARTIALFFLTVITWDFLWFVLNPYYGIRRFKPEYIWWHKKWFLFLPRTYYFALIISALFYLRFSLNLVLLKEWLLVISLLSVFTLIVIIFSFALPKKTS